MKSMNMSRVWMIVLCSLVCMAVVYAANPFSFDEDGNLIITEETEVALGERTVNLVGFDSGGFIEKNSASGSVIGNDDGLSFDFFFIHEGVSTVSYEEGTGFTYHYEGKGDITIETGSIDGNGIYHYQNRSLGTGTGERQVEFDLGEKGDGSIHIDVEGVMSFENEAGVEVDGKTFTVGDGAKGSLFIAGESHFEADNVVIDTDRLTVSIPDISGEDRATIFFDTPPEAIDFSEIDNVIVADRNKEGTRDYFSVFMKGTDMTVSFKEDIEWSSDGNFLSGSGENLVYEFGDKGAVKIDNEKTLMNIQPEALKEYKADIFLDNEQSANDIGVVYSGENPDFNRGLLDFNYGDELNKDFSFALSEQIYAEPSALAIATGLSNTEVEDFQAKLEELVHDRGWVQIGGSESYGYFISHTTDLTKEQIELYEKEGLPDDIDIKTGGKNLAYVYPIEGKKPLLAPHVISTRVYADENQLAESGFEGEVTFENVHEFLDTCSSFKCEMTIKRTLTKEEFLPSIDQTLERMGVPESLQPTIDSFKSEILSNDFLKNGKIQKGSSVLLYADTVGDLSGGYFIMTVPGKEPEPLFLPGGLIKKGIKENFGYTAFDFQDIAAPGVSFPGHYTMIYNWNSNKEEYEMTRIYKPN